MLRACMHCKSVYDAIVNETDQTPLDDCLCPKCTQVINNNRDLLRTKTAQILAQLTPQHKKLYQESCAAKKRFIILSIATQQHLLS